MTTWTELDRAQNAAGDEILLRQRGSLYEIRYNGIELMSNLNHQSEAVLAERSLRLLPHPPSQVLIGGLGMGFTLRAALEALGPKVEVTVCELVPQIIDWNLGPLAPLAGAPLCDPRVKTHCGDVSDLLAQSPGRFDVILLDTDNGPDFLVRESNGEIYAGAGLARTREALTPGGIAAFWSSEPAPEFEARLAENDWYWRRDDIALVPGRVDAMHHIYFASNAPEAFAFLKAA